MGKEVHLLRRPIAYVLHSEAMTIVDTIVMFKSLNGRGYN